MHSREVSLVVNVRSPSPWHQNRCPSGQAWVQDVRNHAYFLAENYRREFAGAEPNPELVWFDAEKEFAEKYICLPLIGFVSTTRSLAEEQCTLTSIVGSAKCHFVDIYAPPDKSICDLQIEAEEWARSSFDPQSKLNILHIWKDLPLGYFSSALETIRTRADSERLAWLCISPQATCCCELYPPASQICSSGLIDSDVSIAHVMLSAAIRYDMRETA